MCGIVGVIALSSNSVDLRDELLEAISRLKHRGPDAADNYIDNNIALGHCRLTIIDLSDAANQPMQDEMGKYLIVYNGEIFNFQFLRTKLMQKGVCFKTNSDTEVLLQMYMNYGIEMLNELNGFFAFAIYDRQVNKVLIARDRYGVKPLYYSVDDQVLYFASEMKALCPFQLSREIDEYAVREYMHLNYIPGPRTIYKSVNKLLPGHYITVEDRRVQFGKYYEIHPALQAPASKNYEKVKSELFDLLDEAVRIRLISDVPLGCFLSGGLDSSIISGLASRHTDKLMTFSIGYAEDPFYDETGYARAVSKYFKTEHTVFKLKRDELAEAAERIVCHSDEPFADSSALPLYILCKNTRRHVKVALSGDGADELFGGYLKHMAEYRARNPGFAELLVYRLYPLLQLMPQSRSKFILNKIRQLNRFAAGMRLAPKERYWQWCSTSSETEVFDLCLTKGTFEEENWSAEKQKLTSHISGAKELTDLFLNDMHLVLSNDMLHKVDSISMANSLEIRTPFLDYRIVDWGFTIPSKWKINKHRRKIILNDTFQDFLPAEIFNRPKKGFEVPLGSLLNQELNGWVKGDLLSMDFIQHQRLFRYEAISKLKDQLSANKYADAAARVWGLLVFQHWWNRNFGNPDVVKSKIS